MLPYSTTVRYRTWVTVETFDPVLVIFRRKNPKKVGKLQAPWKIMSMKITSTGLYQVHYQVQTLKQARLISFWKFKTAL